MTPTIGRIVHANSHEGLPCRAALVTGIDYGAGQIITTIYIAVFSERGDPTRAVLTDDKQWHDPYFCPALLNSNPSPVV